MFGFLFTAYGEDGVGLWLFYFMSTLIFSSLVLSLIFVVKDCTRTYWQRENRRKLTGRVGDDQSPPQRKRSLSGHLQFQKSRHIQDVDLFVDAMTVVPGLPPIGSKH